MEIFGITIVELTVIVAIAICVAVFSVTMHKISRQPQPQRPAKTEEPKEDKQKKKLTEELDKLLEMTEKT